MKISMSSDEFHILEPPFASLPRSEFARTNPLEALWSQSQMQAQCLGSKSFIGQPFKTRCTRLVGEGVKKTLPVLVGNCS